MTENPSVRITESAPAPAKRLVACGWCDSTHIADVTCTCKDPCTQGWCPAAVEFESPWVPVPRDAVA
jgi:hypothetical protein